MYYQMNRETQKLELIFSKEEYMALPSSDKQKIKSNFLFSKYIGGWVSRAKFPNLYFAEEVAKSLTCPEICRLVDSDLLQALPATQEFVGAVAHIAGIGAGLVQILKIP